VIIIYESTLTSSASDEVSGRVMALTLEQLNWSISDSEVAAAVGDYSLDLYVSHFLEELSCARGFCH
jgi:hypothetical protein